MAKKKAARKAKRKSAKKAKRAKKARSKPAARKAPRKASKRKPAKRKSVKKKPAKRKPAKKRAAKKKAAKRKPGKRAAKRPARRKASRKSPAGKAALRRHPAAKPPAGPSVAAPAATVAAPEARSSVVFSGTPQGSAVPAAGRAPAVRAAPPMGPFTVRVAPDWQAFMACIRRQGTPRRVHFAELFLDGEVQDEICRRYPVLEGLDPSDEFYPQRRAIAIQRFLGYDYVVCGPEGLDMPLKNITAEDTAALPRAGGRSFVDEHKGPISNMEEFERYPWPDPAKITTRALEWYEKNLPDDMCVIGGLCGHFAENLAWLMGYETLCYALYDNREVVAAIAQRTLRTDREVVKRLLQFDRVKAVWGSDDMGFRSGTLIGPDDMREFVLRGHRVLASLAHMHGRPYFLHSCGNLSEIMRDLIENVRIDAKHSFEDTIEDVRDAKRRYGSRLALLGGIDVDFLCRSDEDAIRLRVRSTLSTCMQGGGYCLGTGNTVANYVPVESYMAMLDEGRKFAR